MSKKTLSTLPVVTPRFIEPMYATAVGQLPDGGAWTYEAKLDGYRCLAAKRSDGITLWSRRGTLFTDRFSAIAKACEKLPPDTLIDGEVIAIDADGRVSFNALQHSRPNVHIQFYAFDVLVHRGRNMLRLPLETRRELLTDVLKKVEYPALQSQNFDAKPADLIRAAKELRLEGIIAKRKDSYYEPGQRSGAWAKYKINRSQEFVIGGYTPGNPFDAVIVGYYQDRELLYAGKVRAGFVPHVRREVMEKMKALKSDACPLQICPRRNELNGH